MKKDKEREKTKSKEKGDKPNNYKNNDGNKIQKQGQEKQKKDYKFEIIKKSLKGMSKDMITKHKDTESQLMVMQE
jgi:hypothetical protein